MYDATVRGRFVWHELLTTDTAAAAAFYQKVIGWKPQAQPQDSSYTLFVAKAGPVAGLMALPEDAKTTGTSSCWISYVGTPDVDATARQAVEMGGTILKEPTDIPSVGRFAVIQDPQGAVFSAFTPVQSPTSGDAMTPDGFSWHELSTTDRPAAFSFYERLFGWVKTGVTEMGPGMGEHQLFGWPGKTLGAMHSNRHVPGPPRWLAYAMVPDSKRVADLVSEEGGRVLHGPTEVSGGDWIAQLSDPQGAVFAVHAAKPAVPEPVREPAPVTTAAMRPTAPKPAVKRPAAKVPVAQEPAVKKPAAKKPAAKKPAVKKPAAGKPAVKKSVAKRPAAKKPLAKKTASKKAVKKSVAKKPTGKKPAAKKPAAKKFVAKKPTGTKPAAKKPVAKKPLARKAAPKKAAKKAAKSAKPARKAALPKAPAKARAKARAKGKKR